MITRKNLQKWFNEYYNHNEDLLDKTNNKVFYKKGKHTSLFLDELNRANLDVRQASLQMILCKEIHEHTLPYFRGKPSMITACINPEDGYQVEGLDPALYSRFLSINVTVDVTAWLEWAEDNNVILPIRKFIMDNMNKLHWTPNEKERKNVNDTKYPDPRAWTKLSRVLENIPNAKNNPLTLEIIKGKIGESTGTRFYTYFVNFENQITTEDIEKFVYFQNTTDPKEIGELLNEKLLKDQNVLYKNELAQALIEREIQPECTIDTTLATMSILWSLEAESRASILISMSDKQPDKFKLLVSMDTDKSLIKSITNYIAKNIPKT